MPNNDFVPKIWSKYKKCVYYTKIYFLYCYWYNIIILRCSEYHCVIVIVLFYLRQFILPSTGCEDIHTANNVKTAGVNVAWWRRWLMLPSEQRRRMERSWWMRWGANRGQTGWWWERMNQQLKEHQSYSPTISDPVYAKQRKQNKTEKSARLWMKENFVANIDVGEAVLIFFFSFWRRAGRDDKTRSVLQGLFCVLSKSSGDEAPSGKKMSVTTERR